MRYRLTLPAAQCAVFVAALLLLGGANGAAAPESGATGAAAGMASAAQRFLATLKPEQRAAATFAFDAEERFNWQFRRSRDRKGLPLREMTPTQAAAALTFLRTSVSAAGYRKAAAIREVEKIPTQVEGRAAPTSDPGGYFFSIFGDPAAGKTWAWRYEGHHCALNWTLVAGKPIACTPQFFGAEPNEVRVDVPGAPKKGTRILTAEEALGRRLVRSLAPAQRSQGLLPGEAPTNIVTGSARQAAIQENTGISYAALSRAQRDLLLRLIREYTDNQTRDLAEHRLAALRRAGLEKIKFAWMGGLEPGEGHYYRIQGPTFLIEYDNTQHNANHIHSVWRDFKGDFGMDLLAMHYQAQPHRVAAAR